MAIIIGKRTNLDAPIKLESLYGVTFTTEAEAHQFVVRCEQKGQELTLSGTISAKFVRADGNTIQLVGAIVDGAAVVTLAQDCYNVHGRFQLAIFNTVGNTKLCIYACVGTVQNAQSGSLVDGGNIISDVEDLIADIQEARQSIPPTYGELLASIAGTYDSTKTYAVGDYVWYDGSLYRCTTAITTAEAWTSGHWTAAVLGNDVYDLKSALTTPIQLTLENYQATITTNTNKVVPGVSSAWQHAVISVQPGDMIHIITTIYGNTYFGLLFARDDDYVIASYEKATESANKNIDVCYVVPSKATKLYINYRTNQSLTPSAETVITVNGIKNLITDQKPNVLRLISANCGSYNVGDDSDYVSRWRKMYSDMDFDLVALQDSPFSGDYTQANLFGNTVVQNIDSDANPYDIHFESRYNLTDPYLLRVTNTIEYQGQTITNPFRAKFLRAIFEIGNKQIAVYSVHAAPGETAGIVALRAAQFADLIADSENYDGSIMMGDFNTHASSEYAPFTTAGMRLGNCGYVGEIYTLGNSPTTPKVYPADNIITSSNILIRKFAALTDCNLNTDHYPVFAVVEFVQ